MSIKNYIKKLIKKIPIGLSKNHQYDIDTRKIIQKTLLNDSNAIDIGCHEGEILDYFLKYAPCGQHYAFEPLPHLYKNLKSKYTKRAHLYPHALSNKEGTTTFQYVKSNPAYSGLKKRKYDRTTEEVIEITVDQTKLDEMIPDDIRIDLIKIDVEGGEYLVLSGSKRILIKDKPVLIFEHGKGGSDYYGVTPDMLFDLLESYHYNIYNLRSFLKDKRIIDRAEFIRQYEQEDHYYFVAN